MERNSKNTAFSKKEFLELIEELKTTFQENEWCFRASEENVRAEFINPILKALGWKSPFIRYEDKNMDYLLCNNSCFRKSSPKLTIEVKKYCEQLRTVGGGSNKGIKYDNENQLIKYCMNPDINALAGILTNGMRWCFYSGEEFSYKGEIDIRSTPHEDIWKFFNSISRSEFEKIDQNNWCWLTKPDEEEYYHTIIKIDDDPPYIEKLNQCDANYKVARLFIDKCEEMSNKGTITDPLDFVFYRQIISKKTPQTETKKGKKRKSKTQRTKLPYKNKYFLIGDYNIYDKVTLLKEINSTLELGLTIIVE